MSDSRHLDTMLSRVENKTRISPVQERIGQEHFVAKPYRPELYEVVQPFDESSKP